MSELPIKLLSDRIAEVISRAKILAEERDAFRRENGELRSRIESQEKEQAKLRSVLDEAVRELRQG